MSQGLLIGLVSLTTGTFVFALVAMILLRRARGAVETRLDQALAAGMAAEPGQDSAGEGELPSLLRRLVGYASPLLERPWFRWLVGLAASPSRKDDMRRRLARAGLRHKVEPEQVVAAQVLMALAVGLFATGYLLLLAFPLVFWGAAVLAVLMAYRLSLIPLTSHIEARQKSIRRDLPRAADLLVVAVGAGMTFDKAIELYCERFRDPLAYEFRQALNDIQIGRRRREALTDMAERAGVEEVAQFITTILQGERFGVPIAQVLSNLSKDLKLQRNQRIREQAMKAPVKMIFPIMVFIMPAIMCVLMGPLAMQIMRGELF